MSIKAVCFDLGGVLHIQHKDAEQRLFFAEAAMAALEKAGVYVHASPEEFADKVEARGKEYKKWSEQTMVELPSDKAWTEYYLKDFQINFEKVASCAEYLSYLYDCQRFRLEKRPHLLSTVKELYEMGLRQGIISNIISKAFLPECLMRYGLMPFMEKDCIIMSSVVGKRKPSPAIFQAALDALHLQPSELAFVGDRLSRDVIGAKKAKLGCMLQIRLEASIQKDKAFESLGYKPDFMIDDLAEIPAIIAKLNGGNNA
jgi:putative hydrolase of the HAD superfamily